MLIGFEKNFLHYLLSIYDPCVKMSSCTSDFVEGKIPKYKPVK